MRWLWVLLLSIISVLFLIKGIELWSAIDHVDKDGIGITFLGFSITDKVLNERISGYALGFTIASIIPFLVAANIVIRAKIKKNIYTEKI